MNLKDLLFKEEPPKPKPEAVQPAPVTTPTPAVRPESWAMTPLRPTTIDYGTGKSLTSSNVYLILTKATDFWATDEGKIVQKYLDTLTGVISDEDQRLKAALALAAREGVTGVQIAATFSRLQSALNDSKDKFAAQAADWNKEEVQGRVQLISEIDGKISDFQKQIQGLQVQRGSIAQAQADAESKAKLRKSEFDNTFQVRAQELDVLRQKFTK